MIDSKMLSRDERVVFERWIMDNVDETVVPNDEGDKGALIYNLVHLLRGDGKKYKYLSEQDDELKRWGVSANSGSLVYGVLIQVGEEQSGMIAGPTPNLKGLLDASGDENHFICKLVESGPHILMYKWNNEKWDWEKINENS